jgi:predicted enzyme related to lactoylglutathione lyase
MSDPLDVLRADVVPIEPDPAFAARLRARLESEVLNPKGAIMTSDTTPVTVDETPVTEGDVSYASLWVPDIARAEAFYTAVLGWRVRNTGPRSRHVEDVTPHIGMWGDIEHGTLFLCHAVDDVRAAIEKVRAAGGRADEPTQEPFGFVAECTDNQGMRLAVFQAPRAERSPLVQPGPGELIYLTVGVPDTRLFRDFYGAVFGWTFTPGRVDDGWGVTGPAPMMGLHGNAERPSVVPMYAVADINTAVAAVRAAGGTATEPTRMPYGTTSDCVDDQGVPFYLGQA